MSVSMPQEIKERDCKCTGNNCSNHNKCAKKTKYPCPKCGCCEICHFIKGFDLVCNI